jgi:3'-phosphoadenosine 5'-phosphosulfate sulfotransferase (PAPS reductase)/FAD synthetase
MEQSFNNFLSEGKNIVSFGGGTNSTAMLIGMMKKNLIPDHILFADTGGEKEGTYHYIKYFTQ